MKPYAPEPRGLLDSPICKEIEAKQWKQALKLVDKRLNRDNSLWLQALRLYIQCSHSSFPGHVQGMTFFLQFDPKNTNYQADELELLENCTIVLLKNYQTNRKPDIVCQARVASVKADPKDEQLGLDCLRACLEANELGLAMEIIPLLEKNHPEKREYSVWWIVISYLYAMASPSKIDGTSIESEDPQQHLFMKLAFMKLELFAKTSRKALLEKAQLPPKSLQKPQELLLLYRVSREQDNHFENAFVTDSLVGARSSIAKAEWALQLELLDFLLMKKDWKTLYEVSGLILVESRRNNAVLRIKDARGADWAVWTAHLRCVKEFSLQSAKIPPTADYTTAELDMRHQASRAIHLTRIEIETHLKPDSGIDKVYMRNAQLAKMEWIFITQLRPSQTIKLDCFLADAEELPVKFKTSVRVLSLVEFLHDNKYVASAFGDVKPYVEMLEFWEEESFLKLVTQMLSIPGDSFATGIQDHHQNLEKGTSRVPVEQLSNGKDEFRTTLNDITAHITAMKVSFFLKSSSAELARKNSFHSTVMGMDKCRWCNATCSIFCHNCLENIATEAFKLYLFYIRMDSLFKRFLLATDRHPADGFAIIAAMAIIKLANSATSDAEDVLTAQKQSQRLIQAAAILDFAHQKSRPNPDITLLLVSVYHRLGAGSLAMETYQDLNLKQVQIQTLGYVIFDRIATLHPRPHPIISSPQHKQTRPTHDLENLQRWYGKSKEQTLRNSWTSLTQGSYESVFQMKKFIETISANKAVAMSVIECRRVDRLLNPGLTMKKDSHGFHLILKNIVETDYDRISDTFDYKSFPNYEHSEYSPFREFISPGPSMNEHRTVVYLLAERLHELLDSSVTLDKDYYKDCMNRLRTEYIRDTNGKQLLSRRTIRDAQLTTPESEYMILVGLLIPIVLSIVDPEILIEKSQIEETIIDVSYALDMLIELFNPEISKVSGPHVFPLFSRVLHPIYVSQEAKILMAAVIKFLTETGKSAVKPYGKKYVDRLVSIAKRQTAVPSSSADKMKKRMSQPGWLDTILRMVQSTQHDVQENPEFGELVANLIGESGMESFASDVLESLTNSVEEMASICKLSS